MEVRERGCEAAPEGRRRPVPFNHAANTHRRSLLGASPSSPFVSCGVILYALLCGSLPFDDESIPNLFKKIKSGMYSLPSHLSQLARNLIPRMLEVDPMKRITISEIRVHPWFQHIFSRCHILMVGWHCYLNGRVAWLS